MVEFTFPSKYCSKNGNKFVFIVLAIKQSMSGCRTRARKSIHSSPVHINLQRVHANNRNVVHDTHFYWVCLAFSQISFKITFSTSRQFSENFMLENNWVKQNMQTDKKDLVINGVTLIKITDLNQYHSKYFYKLKN